MDTTTQGDTMTREWITELFKLRHKHPCVRPVLRSKVRYERERRGRQLPPLGSSMLIRAAITADEWTALRKAALDRNMSTPEAVAAALRATYDLNGGTK